MFIACEVKQGFEYIPFPNTYKNKIEEIKRREKDKDALIHNTKRKYNMLSKEYNMRYVMTILKEHIEVSWEQIDEDDISLLLQEQRRRMCNKYKH